MNIKLSENIRAFRKAHSLTQQQLADALGVTVGAVYKWEAGLSAPDLSLLVELADLFDTSVDVLLDYEVKSNKQQAIVARLKELLHNRDEQALAEAEKALARYPNCFDVVHQSAQVCYLFGIMTHDKGLLQRSIELFDRAILLLGQNTAPEVSELSLYNDIAVAYSSLGDEEKALEILKKNNPCGINNDMIGLSLAGACDRPDEAVGYLSAALVEHLAALVRIVMGYVNVYFKKQDYASGRSILRLALALFSGFKENDKSNLLDKPCVGFYVCLALSDLELGSADEARRSLREAKRLAGAFDRHPDYSTGSLRYVSAGRKRMAFDDLGETAMEYLRSAVRDMGNDTLTALWEEVAHEE